MVRKVVQRTSTSGTFHQQILLTASCRASPPVKRPHALEMRHAITLIHHMMISGYICSSGALVTAVSDATGRTLSWRPLSASSPQVRQALELANCLQGTTCGCHCVHIMGTCLLVLRLGLAWALNLYKTPDDDIVQCQRSESSMLSIVQCQRSESSMLSVLCGKDSLRSIAASLMGERFPGEFMQNSCTAYRPGNRDSPQCDPLQEIVALLRLSLGYIIRICKGSCCQVPHNPP